MYGALGRFAGLVVFATTAILGQAELVGEPYRHWITVTAICATAIWAYCMHPGSAKDLVAMAKRPR